MNIHYVLRDIDIIMEDEGHSPRTVAKVREFLDLMIAHAIMDKKINIKEIGERVIVSIREGKLSYNKNHKDLRVQITQKIKEMF